MSHDGDMARFAKLTFVPVMEDPWTHETSWPAGNFDSDPRMRRVHEGWQDWLGAMTKDELREFRDAKGLAGHDLEVDEWLDGGLNLKVLVECLEWEG